MATVINDENYKSLLEEGKPVQFTGFDTDQTMLRYSAMNLMLHAIDCNVRLCRMSARSISCTRTRASVSFITPLHSPIEFPCLMLHEMNRHV